MAYIAPRSLGRC